MRVRYVAATNMGMFEVVVDGTVLETIDAYAENWAFPAPGLFRRERDASADDPRDWAQEHASEGYVVGLDAIEVFRGDANTLILPPPATTSTPTPEPQPAARIELVGAPPTVQPTGRRSRRASSRLRWSSPMTRTATAPSIPPKA